ncbi:histidine triad (HIT) family protein [Phyllobacterium ifriqiyense]|uniref:Histidine triad (HIT) family protein n=1 Tax=Phyllobacterium ifriqiyense TaxID=314238 RepID=A0ABU0SHM7_9HYPH|nr:HIT family protein [Phyllobacterium ifriqiyense]MDQ0999203.1 histidine triad (HIT) family protein [Phyllobacterium ifriqiyense]
MNQQYESTNIFARILRGEIPSHKIYEDDRTYALMDVMPQGKGHCLVLTKSPSRNLLDADTEALSAAIATTQKIAQAVVKAFNADGVGIAQFNESAAGQTVFHLHFHVIPRFEGIALKPHSGTMEDNAVLAANAEKIRAALAEL